jgi:Uri superfamily endonuclease
MLKSQPGTYAFILSSTRVASIAIGKLGSLQLQPGFHVYIGSAYDPRWLQARLGHHLKSLGNCPHLYSFAFPCETSF